MYALHLRERASTLRRHPRGSSPSRRALVTLQARPIRQRRPRRRRSLLLVVLVPGHEPLTVPWHVTSNPAPSGGSVSSSGGPSPGDAA